MCFRVLMLTFKIQCFVYVTERKHKEGNKRLKCQKGQNLITIFTKKKHTYISGNPCWLSAKEPFYLFVTVEINYFFSGFYFVSAYRARYYALRAFIIHFFI